jgi:hypothetical protein
MSIKDIWSAAITVISDFWNWLINADLLIGAKDLGIIIIGLLVFGILLIILEKIRTTYNRWLAGLYNRHPTYLNGLVILCYGGFVIGVIGTWGFVISDIFRESTLYFAGIAALSFLGIVFLKEPEQRDRNKAASIVIE